MNATTAGLRPANFTRRSADFVTKFREEGRSHLIPIYRLLRLSDFAREGMEHSGSFRFADHLYRARPSGRGPLGFLLDAVLLHLPATRSMRGRYHAARRAMADVFRKHQRLHGTTPFRLLTAPCGIPRDVRDFLHQLSREHPKAAASVEYTGLDLDPEAISVAQKFLYPTHGALVRWRTGNALESASYPAEPQHFVSSTGLGEFLDDEALLTFYGNVHAALAPGGTFFTSAAARGRGSDFLLRTFELEIHYRTTVDVERILRELPWASLEFTRDRVGLQTFVRAVKA